MKLSLDNLAVHLKQAVQRSQLATAYLVSGDEDLLVGEACDAIRAAARAVGFVEREMHFPERGSDWTDIVASLSSMSLFGDRRIVEIRFSGKAGKEGGAALQKMLESAGAETLLLVMTPRLDYAAQNTAWVKAIESKAAWLPIWEIGPRQLESWLLQRLRAAGLEPTTDAVALLALRVEGNLLAAKQEIEKLKLVVRAGRLDATTVLEAVTLSARYDVFGLGEAVVSGDASRTLRILSGLRGEGTEPTLVLWSITRELRNLWALRRGGDPSRRPGPRPSPAQLAALERAQARVARMPFARLASRAFRADRMIKGRLAGDPWDELTLLCAECCGLRPIK